MVFVHARKETVKSAQAIREAALADGTLDDFSTQEHPTFSLFRRDIGTSRNKEMKELFNDGFGIHHAGMLRSDRNMMERMFEARAIKVGLMPYLFLFPHSHTQVLCCTATLAWGVNLPAHAGVFYDLVTPFQDILLCHSSQSSSKAHKFTTALGVHSWTFLY